MIQIFTIVAPVFLIMALGYWLGGTRLFPEKASDAMITFVWYVAIPALMFRAIASAELPHADELFLVLGYYSSLGLLYAIAVIAARWIFKLNPAEQGVFALSSCFANGGFLGIPVLEGAYGDEGVRLLLVILSFHSLFLLTTTTIIVERASKLPGGGSVFAKILSRLAHNPLLIALISGLTWSALNLPFPYWLDRVLALPAQSASPVGLFAAGMALSGVTIAGDLRHASTAVALKLLVLPALVYCVTTWVVPLPPMWVGVATLTAALPTGMVAYTFATQYGVGTRRAVTTVMISSGLSALTLSSILAILGVGSS
jgi:predicted permease